MSYDPISGIAIISTTGAPASSVGINGWYAIDFSAKVYYLKTAGSWSASSPFGATGAAGSNGTNGTNGVSGNTLTVNSKTANYTVLSGDLTGTTPIFFMDCTSGNLTLTIDASLLFASGLTQSVMVKRIDSTANTLTIAAGASQTVDGAASIVIPANSLVGPLGARTVVAKTATALYVI